MSKTVKDKVIDAAKNVGDAIAEGAENAVKFVKEKTGIDKKAEGTNTGIAGIKDRMKVIALCGKTIGIVDHAEAGAIKLTRRDSPDDRHHFIPFSWIARVDSHVHLNKNAKEAEQEWKSDANSCRSCG